MIKPMTTRRFWIAGLCCLMAGASLAANRYVIPPVADRVPGFDYSGYTPLYTTIQSAVNVAFDLDHVVLLPGTYKLSAQVAVEGKSIFIRAISTNAFDRARTIVDGQGKVRAFFLRLTATTIRDLTLRNGKAPVLAAGDSYGGAVYIEDGGVLENCVIENSTAAYGGGVRLYGSGEVRDSVIRNNIATVSGGGVLTTYGGSVANCVIYQNEASDKGGGVYCFDGGEVSQSTIYSNTAYYGGGVRFYYDKTFRPKLSRSRIYRNKAVRRSTSLASGGGVQISRGGTVENCVIHDNEADGQGGGVYVFQAATLMNNTIAHNLTTDKNGDGVGDGTGGGVFTSGGGTLQNNILMSNNSGIGPNYASEGTAAVYRNNLASPSIPGNGNIAGPPLFRDEAARDYYLQPTSPCIDTGANAGAPTVDFAGTPRPLIGKLNSTTRVTDIGAYEYFENDYDAYGVATYWKKYFNLDYQNANEYPPGDLMTYLQKYEYSLSLLGHGFAPEDGLNPHTPDTDGDGLPDYDEVSGMGKNKGFITNPLLADTDGDGFSDKFEIDNDTDPTNPLSFPTTISGTISYSGTLQTSGVVRISISSANMTTRTAVIPGLGSYTVTNVPTRLPLTITAYRDGDNTNGMANFKDTWEPAGAYAGNPLTLAGAQAGINIVLADPATDTDGDGLSDFEEIFIHGTKHLNADTDGDGMPDGWEVFFGLNPLSAADAALDTDGDGLTNLSEYQISRNRLGDTEGRFNPAAGLNPNNPDTDGDGMPDGWETLYPGKLNPLVADGHIDFDGDGLTNLQEYQIGTNPTNRDTDGDGLPDGWEAQYMPTLNPLVNDAAADPDFDGLTNEQEYSLGTDPTNPDTDGDGMPDGWEAQYMPKLNPLVHDAAADGDGDGLSNYDEYLLGTDPTNPDTDGDGVSDGVEVAAGTDPLDPLSYPVSISGTLVYSGVQTGLYHVVVSQVPTGAVYTATVTNAGPYTVINAANGNSYTVKAFLDVNGNATQDTWEARGTLNDTNGVPLVLLLTNQLTGADIVLQDSDVDSDGDGLSDYDELMIHGTNPFNPDTDSDGMPDGWEVLHGLDPLDGTDWNIDTDGDGLKNLDEYLNGTDPNNPDTDGDGLTDGEEIHTYGTNPLVPDTDGDGLRDYDEIMVYFTNPLVSDTDGDGFNDGLEVQVGTDPLNVFSFPATISGLITYVGSLTGVIHVAAVDAETNMYTTTLAVPGTYSLANLPTLKTYVISAYMDTTGDQVPDTWEAQDVYSGSPVVLTNNLPDADMMLTHPATDTDGDGLSDYDEVILHGTDPAKADTDEDGMPDGWEVFFGLDPLDPSDAGADADSDGMSNLAEYNFSTNYFGTIAFDPADGLDPQNADTDGDDMPDGWEVFFGLDPLDAADALGDPDLDGMTNLAEYQYSLSVLGAGFDPADGLDPTDPDTDNDGFKDGEEVLIGSDPLDAASYPFVVSGTVYYGGTQTGTVWLVATAVDSVVSNALTMAGTSVVYSVSNLVTSTEYTILAYRDSTGDGNYDPWEAIGDYAGNPIMSPSSAITGVDVVLVDPVTDTDGDGLTDYDEVYVYLTDPLDPDTDGDDMPDGWEVHFNLDPLDAADAAADPDDDGMTNLEEYQYSLSVLGAGFDPADGLDPRDADTDDDLMPDGWEVHFGLNPLDAADALGDPDTDGMTSLAEYQYSLSVLGAGFDPAAGLDPTNPDSDGDGMPDGWEVHFGLNPLDVADAEGNPDSDGMTSLEEYQYSLSVLGAGFDPVDGLDPTDPDSDGDGRQDGFEVQWQSDPLNDASFPVTMTGMVVNDTMPVLTGTVYIVLHYESNANHFANFSVGDVTTDGPQPPFTVQYVPTLSNYWITAFMDLNGDGQQDAWEPYGVAAATVTNSITPTNDFWVGMIPLVDSLVDSDGDGLTNYDEVNLYGTDPFNPDTDGDGFSDFEEVMTYFTDPLNRDSFPASIAGSVSYAGTQTGPLVTVADAGLNVYSNSFGDYAAGPYSTPTNLPTLTNYTLTVYIDSNTNGVLDLWEARGVLAGSPFLLTTNRVDANIVIEDPSGDTDGDGLSDFEEHFVYFTDPENRDTDGDGMPDGWEVVLGLNPLDLADAGADPDGDGMTNLEEYRFSLEYLIPGADPLEMPWFDPADGLDPFNPDSDGDGLSDGDEVNLHLTDPLNPDTDGDGMPDGWEEAFGLDPLADDSAVDADSDGLTNLQEYQYSLGVLGAGFAPLNGLAPTNWDTDGDGLSDGDEINRHLTDPLDPDTDGDGFTDYEEVIEIGSDPNNAFDPVVVDGYADADPVKGDPGNNNYFEEDGSLQYPYDSIEEGVVRAEDGYTVLVMDGGGVTAKAPYKSAGNININPGGKRITIRSRNGRDYTEILVESGNAFIINSGEGADTIIQGFTIRTSVADLGSAGILVNGASPTIRDCRFFDCGEAGVLVRNGGRPLIIDSVFEANQGGIKIIESHPRIERSILKANVDAFGGGIWITGTSAVTSQPVIVNCLIVQNTATDSGGGIYAGANTRAMIVGTTIADNVATVRGGGIYNAGSTELVNGILWGNTAPSGPGFFLASAFVTSYSCMQTERPLSIGVFVADPQFAGPNNYEILSSSPCINKGVPYVNPLVPTNDIRQLPRTGTDVNDPRIAHDVGAYEYQAGGALYLQSPGGTAGQVVEAGLAQTVTWTYDGTVGTNLVLEYTYDFLAAPTWTLISSNVFRGNGGSGSYSWTVPVTNTARCFVRVSDATNSLIFGHSPVEFAITNGIQIYAPVVSQTNYLGQTVTVEWASSPSTNSTATLGLSTNGGVSYLTTNVAHIAGGTTNSFDWVLNSAAYLTTNGRIRVSSGAMTKTSAAVLVIRGLEVTHPLSGTVQTGMPVNVRWTSLGAGPAVDIAYSADGGGSYVPVTNGVANVNGTNVFAWTVPVDVTTNARIRVSSPSDLNIVGTSGTFEITDSGGNALSLAGDGIPDSWKIAHGLDPENLDGQSGAHDDPDGDGASNWHEWLAGTNPLDSDSVLGILSLGAVSASGDPAPDSSGIVLRWRTIPGRLYIVETTETLGGGWTNASGLLEAAGDELDWTDPQPVERRFYRIGTLSE